MRLQFPVNTNRPNKPSKSLSQERQSTAKVSASNEFLWALIGLLLTIFSTFIEAFITNPPWKWAEHGIVWHSLGVTYQIGAVLLTGCMGGKNAGVLSQIAYLILGLIWLPIFARGGGWDYLGKPSFGYLLGFIPGAWLCGWLAFRTRRKLESLAFSAICGLAVIHICGLIYLVGLTFLGSRDNPFVASDNLFKSIEHYSIMPLPGQLVIVCVVAAIAFILRQILFY